MCNPHVPHHLPGVPRVALVGVGQRERVRGDLWDTRYLPFPPFPYSITLFQYTEVCVRITQCSAGLSASDHLVVDIVIHDMQSLIHKLCCVCV